MAILDIMARQSGQLNADGERITKWIHLGPEWKFLVIIGTIMVVLSTPFLILDLMEIL